MSELSPGALELVEAGRKQSLSEERRKRGRARLLASVGLGAALGGAASSAAAAASGLPAAKPALLALLAKIGVGTAIVVAAGFGARAAFFGAPSENADVRASTPVAHATSPPAKNEPVLPAPAAAAAADAPAAAASAVPPPPVARAARGNATSIDSDMRLLQTVDSALRAGDPQRALKMLDERKSGHAGALAPERAAAEVFSLCALGRESEAAARARAFLRNWPQSPLAPRVRAGCSSPSPAKR